MAINYPKKAIDRTGCFQKIREPPSDSGKVALNNIHTSSIIATQKIFSIII